MATIYFAAVIESGNVGDGASTSSAYELGIAEERAGRARDSTSAVAGRVMRFDAARIA